MSAFFIFVQTQMVSKVLIVWSACSALFRFSVKGAESTTHIQRLNEALSSEWSCLT